MTPERSRRTRPTTVGTPDCGGTAVRESSGPRWSGRPRRTKRHGQTGRARGRQGASRRREGDAGPQAGGRAGARLGQRPGPCHLRGGLRAAGRGWWAKRSATASPRQRFFCVRGPWTFGLGGQRVSDPLLDTRRGQGYLRLLGSPDLNLAIAGKAVRGLEFFLQRRQGGRGDTLVDRGPGLLIAQGRVAPHLRQDKHEFPLITCRYAAIGSLSWWLAWQR